METDFEKKYINKKGENLILLLSMKGEDFLIGSVFRSVSEKLPDIGFTLSVYEAEDWDGDFSPWEFEMNEKRIFAGNGRKTLEEIKEKITEKYNRIYIAGYSLAGLFSLWAIHEENIFDGCASCSGSLWFGGWKGYSEKNKIKKQGVVYLSLGGKEDKAKDPIVSTILKRTKEEDKILSKDENVRKHILVMNPGGHFASPDKRLAQGIIWLLTEGTKI